MTSALQDLLTRHLEAGTYPGAVALLGVGDEVDRVAVGRSSIDGPPMRPDAIVRIQSMTKAVTSVAALRLVEAGRIELDDSVEELLPEIAARPALRRPDAPLDDVEPATGPVTLRHLLTNQSGYGMITVDSPLQVAMRANGTEAGADPPDCGADEWMARMGELPRTFQPGAGWRYHHSFALLGVLISRLVGRALGDHLADDLFGPLGMVDTGFFVPEEKLARLPAAYRHADGSLEETEPAGGGFYAGPPPFDVSHAELVATAADYHRFLAMLVAGGTVAGDRFVAAEHVRLMTTDQVDDAVKREDDFFPGFWSTSGWGFGVGVQTGGARVGTFEWAGGQGTIFFVRPDGVIAILLTQVEIGPELSGLIEEFQQLA